MKTHPGRDRENPCVFEHSYYCAVCARLFSVDVDSHWRHPKSGKIFVSLYWPACSFTCYSLKYQETSVLETAHERGDTTIDELEHLFDYIADDGFIEPDLGDLAP